VTNKKSFAILASRLLRLCRPQEMLTAIKIIRFDG